MNNLPPILCPDCEGKGWEAVSAKDFVEGGSYVRRVIEQKCVTCGGRGSFERLHVNEWRPGKVFIAVWTSALLGVLAFSFYVLWLAGRTNAP